MDFSGERLRTVRNYKQMTIRSFINEFNQKMNMKLTTGLVSKWETNKVTPRVETIQTLADYFEVPVDYLFGRKNVGICLLHKRLLAGLSIPQLSEKSGVDEKIINLTETGTGLLKDEEELMNIEKALNINDFRSYLENEGVFAPCTYEEVAYDLEYKEELEQDMKEEEEEKVFFQSIENIEKDIYLQLEYYDEVYFNGHLLTTSQKVLFKTILKAIMEEKYNH